MELLIKGKNLQVDDQTQEFIRDKMKKLERHLPDIDEVKVEIVQEKTKAAEDQFVVQITAEARGAILRAEERGPSVNAGIDVALDLLDRQIKRFKGRAYRSNRREQSPWKVASEPSGLDEGKDQQHRIVKVKRFPVKPMSPEEAVEQMELLSHDFFIFFNPDIERFSVLYRRGDGDYGLIEPELG